MIAKRKILSVTVSILMILALLTIYIPSRVSAAGGTPDKFNGNVTYKNGDNISLTSGSKTEGTILIEDGATVNLEISDLTINNTTIDAPCIKVGKDSTLNLTLTGSNVLTTTKTRCNSAGIDTSGGTIKIYDNANKNGSLTATGVYYGAGIGGGYGESGGNINIYGGSITATSDIGAGIGGGTYGSGGNINISGGSIKGTSDSGAGIGGGNDGSGGNINISGGSIKATSNNGAGIGGGYCESGGNINISGGSIKATGGNFAADIGVGYMASLAAGEKNIITGGSVNPTNNNVSPAPTKSDGSTPVTMNTLGVGSNKLAVNGLYFNPKTFSYGFQDVVSDTNNNIYIWLPKGVEANTIGKEFPNSNIAIEVVNNIKGSTIDSFLTKDMAESVTDLELQSKGLDNGDSNTKTSLDNINDFTNLTELYLSLNKLTEKIDIRGLKNLQTLDLDNDQLTVLPDLSKLTNLLTLELTTNNLTDQIDLSGLRNLKSLTGLYLNDNQLTVLPDLSGLTNLSIFWAANNHLIDIPGLANAKTLSNVYLKGETYVGKAGDISIGKAEEIQIPIVKEITDKKFSDFNGYTYKLTSGGVTKDIAGDVLVTDKGVTIPSKDIGLIGKYTLNIVGTSAVSGTGVSSGYTGDYTYSFSVGNAPAPVPVPVPKPTPGGGIGTIVPSKTNGVISKLPNTGEMVIMYVGLGLIIGGLGIYLTSKKMKAKKK